MKSFFYTYLILVFASCFLQSCNSKEAKLNVPLRGSSVVFDETTPLGKERKKIYDTYDVVIEYKWNRYAFAMDVIADPVKYDDVMPYIEVLKVLYFEAMDKVSGNTNYSKNETPLTIYLMGSGINYGGLQSFGESSAGQAGNIQPNRLSLGGINEFGQALRVKGAQGDKAFLSAIFDKSISSNPGEAGQVGFIYHEYTHYMDAKHDIPKGFEKPAFDNYLRGGDGYKRVSDNQARQKGFMLPYGMQNEHEDLATYVQIMIWKDRNFIERNYLKSDATKKKYEMVYKYYKDLGLDLFKLQTYLHNDEVKKKLLTIKHKYDGTNP